MEEKRKELMQLIISMTDEEHLDNLLEVARFVSSVEGNIHNRLDMEDYLMGEILECEDAEIPRIVSFIENCCKKGYQE